MATLEEALAKIAELEKLTQAQQKRIEELEARLHIYENSHVPSSKRIIREEKVTESPPKKRGAPEGHTGATRQTPIPDEIIDLKPKKCTCGCKNIEILKVHTKIVEDVEIIKRARKFYSYECHCKGCNKRFITTHAGFPKEGKFGPNITSLWQNLHYQGTIPFDRLSTISENCFGINISPGGLHNVVYRTAGIFQPNFDGIKRRVAKSKYARSDETGYPFDGKCSWLWNISTERDVLVLLRDSRGSKVLKEVLGDFFDGILNSDCFSAYSKFKAREYQKCWAHVLGDAKDIGKHSEEGEELHRMLSQMFRYITKIKKKKHEGTPKVKLWMRKAKKKMVSWLDKNWESKAVMNLVLRMAKYRDHWFTCLKYPFVEPTNNASERDIRKNVIARKISGQHRSELGRHSREIMMSTILTLKKRDENPFSFVRSEIEKYNLDSGPPNFG